MEQDFSYMEGQTFISCLNGNTAAWAFSVQLNPSC